VFAYVGLPQNLKDLKKVPGEGVVRVALKCGVCACGVEVQHGHDAPLLASHLSHVFFLMTLKPDVE